MVDNFICDFEQCTWCDVSCNIRTLDRAYDVHTLFALMMVYRDQGNSCLQQQTSLQLDVRKELRYKREDSLLSV